MINAELVIEEQTGTTDSLLVQPESLETAQQELEDLLSVSIAAIEDTTSDSGLNNAWSYLENYIKHAANSHTGEIANRLLSNLVMEAEYRKNPEAKADHNGWMAAQTRNVRAYDAWCNEIKSNPLKGEERLKLEILAGNAPRASFSIDEEAMWARDLRRRANKGLISTSDADWAEEVVRTGGYREWEIREAVKSVPFFKEVGMSEAKLMENIKINHGEYVQQRVLGDLYKPAVKSGFPPPPEMKPLPVSLSPTQPVLITQ